MRVRAPKDAECRTLVHTIEKSIAHTVYLILSRKRMRNVIISPNGINRTSGGYFL